MNGRLRISPEISALFSLIGVLLIIIGLFLVFLGAIPAEKAEGGGLIIIGPLPIIFHGEINPIILLLVLMLPILVFLGYVLYIMKRLLEAREEG